MAIRLTMRIAAVIAVMIYVAIILMVPAAIRNSVTLICPAMILAVLVKVTIPISDADTSKV